MPERESNWDDRLDYAALTDVGMRRSNNQDALTVVLASDLEVWNERGHFFIVADGMGAHAAGELASKLAVDGISHLYYKYTELAPAAALQRAIVETNSEVHRRGQANSDFRHMGTTASMLSLLPQGALIAHIGDSRVYRLREGRIEQLTFDHSLVWELKAAGQIAANGDLAQSIPKNVITRSLGPNAAVQVDIEGPLPTQLGDTFLLCSDGLTGKIEDEELASILANLPPADAARLLVDLANLRGGPDNITVIVAKVVKPELATGGAVEPDPGRVGARKRKPMNPAVWVATAVALLIALVLLITDRLGLSLAATVAAGFVYLAGLLAVHRRSAPGIGADEKRLGRGPYTSVRCPNQRAAAEMLARISQSLRQCEAGEIETLDWEAFDSVRSAAAEAENQERFHDAIQGYARAIRELMRQVREHQSASSDSAIDF